MEETDDKKVKFTSEVLMDSQDKTLEVSVQSVDEKTEDLVNTILDMHSDDFDFILQEINGNEEKEEEEKKSS